MNKLNEWVVILKNKKENSVVTMSEPIGYDRVASKIRKILAENEKTQENNLMIEVLPNE